MPGERYEGAVTPLEELKKDGMPDYNNNQNVTNFI
jgi:hypothetical protein